MFERFFQRIRENAQSPASGPVLIAALGDSVTQGCMQSCVIDPQGVYHAVLKRELEKRHPATTFSVINAGVGGESTSGGLRRLERDVIAHRPDLLLVGFCLNDSCGGLTGLEAYRKNLRELLRKARRKTQADLILLTPNFMASRKNPQIAPEHQKYTDTIIGCQKNGTLRAFVEALRQTAAELEIPVADVYAQWEKLEQRGEDTTSMLVNGLNHPGRTGHRLIARTILTLLQKAADAAEAGVDSETKSAAGMPTLTEKCPAKKS